MNYFFTVSGSSNVAIAFPATQHNVRAVQTGKVSERRKEQLRVSSIFSLKKHVFLNFESLSCCYCIVREIVSHMFAYRVVNIRIWVYQVTPRQYAKCDRPKLLILTTRYTTLPHYFLSKIPATSSKMVSKMVSVFSKRGRFFQWRYLEKLIIFPYRWPKVSTNSF